MALSTSDINRIKTRISNVLQTNANVTLADASALLSMKDLHGKLYEAHVLATVCENLHLRENLRLELINTGIVLRQKGKSINRSDPYFEVFDIDGKMVAELWTDIYFYTISHSNKGSAANSRGDFHELDIALIHPNCMNKPKHTEIIIAIECKFTKIKKNIIREVLGFRRELAFYRKEPLKTGFTAWPATEIKSFPPSIHMLYCSDGNVSDFNRNCSDFGVILVHHTI